MTGSHNVLIDPALRKAVLVANEQIAGLRDIMEACKRYLEQTTLGPDYSGGVHKFIPKTRRGYLEPAPVASVVFIHVRVDPAYATIIGLYLPERKLGWGVPPPKTGLA